MRRSNLRVRHCGLHELGHAQVTEFDHLVREAKHVGCFLCERLVCVVFVAIGRGWLAFSGFMSTCEHIVGKANQKR